MTADDEIPGLLDMGWQDEPRDPHTGEWVKMGGGGWEGRDRALADWFHPQQLEATRVKHPRSGFMVESGLGRTVSRPPEDTSGVQGLFGPRGPATFDVKDYGDPNSPEYNSLKYMGGNRVGTEPIQHVYRGVSEDEWQQAQRRGYLRSDMRGAVSQEEGTNAAADPSTAVSYLPSEGHSRVVKIEVRSEDQWFTIRADPYLRTRQPVPLDRVVAVSPLIRKHGKYDELQVQPGTGQPGLTVKDYEGTVGDPTHITRTETGTVPTSVVAGMHGVNGEVPGEHRNRQGAEWEAFKADITAHGIRNPVFITVDHGQEPKISEGSHRRDAAAELGLPHVPVEIRYFGHSELQGTVTERAQVETSNTCPDCGCPADGLAVELAAWASG